MAEARTYQSIKAFLDALSTPETSSTPNAIPREHLLLLADALKTETAKFGLVCGSEGCQPTPAEVESLLAGLEQQAAALCDGLRVCSAGAGPTLHADIKKAAAATINPCLALVRAVGAGNPGDVKRQVALTWQGCDGLSKLPADSRAALLRRLLAVLAVLADVQREMDELKEQQQEVAEDGEGEASSSGSDTDRTCGGEANAGGGGGGAHGAATNGTRTASIRTAAAGAGAGARESSGGTGAQGADSEPPAPGGFEADLDYEAEPLSEAERQLLCTSREVVAVAGSVVKAFARALVQGSPLQAGTDNLELWESCLFHARHLQRCVEDLGAAMYPPQDVEEVVSAAQAAVEQLQLMLDEAPAQEEGALGVAGGLAALERRLAAAAAQLPAELDSGGDSSQEGASEGCSGESEHAE